MPFSKKHKHAWPVLPKKEDSQGYLYHHFLVAMPHLQEPAFKQSVIYLCAHGAGGSIGVIINHPLTNISFQALLAQLKMPMIPAMENSPQVYNGGPLIQTRGFVLHSTDIMQKDSLQLHQQLGVTGSLDILEDIAKGTGPKKSLLALGYAGWGAGQLDQEIKENLWIPIPFDESLMYDTKTEEKWSTALKSLGIDRQALSSQSGSA